MFPKSSQRAAYYALKARREADFDSALSSHDFDADHVYYLGNGIERTLLGVAVEDWRGQEDTRYVVKLVGIKNGLALNPYTDRFRYLRLKVGPK